MTTRYRRAAMPVPFRMRLRLLARVGFVLLILALIPLVLQFQTQDLAARRFSGLVEAESETVGAVEAARILSVDVQAGQAVQPGDVLVRLELADRAVDLAMAEARLKDYEQDLRRSDQDAQRQRQVLRESARHCRQAVQEASVALEAEKMNRVRDQAEQVGLKAEIERLQPLVDRHLVSETELSRLRPKAQALEQTVAQYAPLIAALEQRHQQALEDLHEAERLLATAEAPPPDPDAAGLQQAVATCRQTVGQDPTVLRATRAGTVSLVLRQKGDVVPAGEPIVRVTAVGTPGITGLLTLQQAQGLAVGDRLRVTRVVTGAQVPLTAQVVSIDPEVMDLLDPLNPTPRFPVRGQRVHLRVLEPDHALLPGESVVLESGHRETLLEGVRRLCSLTGNRPRSAVKVPDNES